jgi:hypothetical protein
MKRKKEERLTNSADTLSLRLDGLGGTEEPLGLIRDI